MAKHPPRQPMKNQVDLISIASMNAGIKSSEMKEYVDEYLKACANAISQGFRLTLPHIGTLRFVSVLPTTIAIPRKGKTDLPGKTKLKMLPKEELAEKVAKLPYEPYMNKRQQKELSKILRQRKGLEP